MRQTYIPPQTRTDWRLTLSGASAITLGVFLVLPLTQIVSSGVRRQLDISKIDTAAPPPPPPTEVQPPPPPPPPEEEPPPPQLNESPRPLSLGDLDLDFAAGTGGAFGSAMDLNAGEALQEIAVFDIADLDQRPQPIAQPAPRHPPELLKSRTEGSVVVVFVLDENGRVQDPQVEYCSHPEFERPALQAVAKWRFKPGTRGGKPVRSYVRQSIAFKVSR